MNDFDAAFFTMQIRIQQGLQAQVMNIAREAIENNAKLKAERLDAEFQRRRFEAETRRS